MIIIMSIIIVCTQRYVQMYLRVASTPDAGKDGKSKDRSARDAEQQRRAYELRYESSSNSITKAHVLYTIALDGGVDAFRFITNRMYTEYGQRHLNEDDSRMLSWSYHAIGILAGECDPAYDYLARVIRANDDSDIAPWKYTDNIYARAVKSMAIQALGCSGRPDCTNIYMILAYDPVICAKHWDDVCDGIKYYGIRTKHGKEAIYDMFVNGTSGEVMDWWYNSPDASFWIAFRSNIWNYHSTNKSSLNVFRKQQMK
jgi:hypothetical protein